MLFDTDRIKERKEEREKEKCEKERAAQEESVLQMPKSRVSLLRPRQRIYAQDFGHGLAGFVHGQHHVPKKSAGAGCREVHAVGEFAAGNGLSVYGSRTAPR